MKHTKRIICSPKKVHFLIWKANIFEIFLNKIICIDNLGYHIYTSDGKRSFMMNFNMKATTSHILTDKKRQSHLMLLYSFQFIDTFGGTIIITMTKPLHQDVSGRACPILSCRGETKIVMVMVLS